MIIKIFNIYDSMKEQIKLILLMIIIPLLAGSCSDEGPGYGKKMPDWELTDRIDLTRSEQSSMDGMEEFSHKLMVKSAEHSENGEFCISPVSVSIYLGILANATSGECRDQILQALGSQDIDELNTLSRKLLRYLPCDENGSSLAISNSFWVAKGINPTKEFVSTEAYYYNAPVESVDFHKENTIGAINKWVYENTKGKIPGIFDYYWEEYKDTKMVGASAVYFKGDWESQFSKSKTVSGKFKTPSGEVATQMMHKTLLAAPYFENDTLQYVRLGFEKYANTMDFFLPAENMDMLEFVKYLTVSKMTEIRESIDAYTLILSMPSFKKESSSRILDILKDINMPSLEKADVSPMGIKEMQIDPIHKVSIKVDETGAELAAVTANPPDLILGGYEADRKVTVDFDRPFVYLIRNRITGAILMAGILNDPR